MQRSSTGPWISRCQGEACRSSVRDWPAAPFLLVEGLVQNEYLPWLTQSDVMLGSGHARRTRLASTPARPDAFAAASVPAFSPCPRLDTANIPLMSSFEPC